MSSPTGRYPGAVVEYGVRFTKPVVVPNDDKGATIEVSGKVAAKLDDNTVRVDLTAMSAGPRSWACRERSFDWPDGRKMGRWVGG